MKRLPDEERKQRNRARKRRYYAANLERERKSRRLYAKKRRLADPQGMRLRAQEYRVKNPWPYRRCAWRRQGIDVAKAEAILRAHTGRCDLCGADSPGRTSWHVDHDHSTGRIRGVLCALCNHALGTVDRVGLEKIRSYLQRGSARTAMKVEVNPLANSIGGNL